MAKFSWRAGACLLLATVQLASVSARNIFHFGDSYSSTSFDPNKALPSKENPIGNPDFPGSTIFGGSNFIGDLITDNPTSGGSPTLIYNYAVFGAFVNNTLENGDPSKPDLIGQYGQFSAHKDLLKGSEDVISIYFGTNDINAWKDETDKFGDIIGSMANVMDELYADGARRFVVFGMDPLYRAPGYTIGGDSEMSHWLAAFMAVIDWDWQIRSQVDSFRGRHPDANVLIYDTAPAFDTVLDDPTAYGAPNSTCYDSDGKSCLWLDMEHPTAAIHKELAKGFEDTLKQIKFF